MATPASQFTSLEHSLASSPGRAPVSQSPCRKSLSLGLALSHRRRNSSSVSTTLAPLLSFLGFCSPSSGLRSIRPIRTQRRKHATTQLRYVHFVELLRSRGATSV